MLPAAALHPGDGPGKNRASPGLPPEAQRNEAGYYLLRPRDKNGHFVRLPFSVTCGSRRHYIRFSLLLSACHDAYDTSKLPGDQRNALHP